MLHAAIPSPSHGVWYLGTIPVRAYALCILLGIVAAVAIGDRRFIARGGNPGQVADVAVWAVPFGVVGGRLYHVLTDWSAYFSDGGKGALGALRIWEGGLGIWGAIALGGVGAYYGCKRHGVPFAPFADAVAPGIAVAQAMGRWGNYFNQELFGRPTNLPWGLSIDPVNRPVGYEQASTFHPVFLYESIACLVIAVAVVWADKRFRLGHGRTFALYVGLYCVARGGLETLRIDEAHHILGVRLNVFTALIVGAGALAYFVRSSERHQGREPMRDGRVLAGRRRADIPSEHSEPDAPRGRRRAAATQKKDAQKKAEESPTPVRELSSAERLLARLEEQDRAWQQKQQATSAAPAALPTTEPSAEPRGSLESETSDSTKGDQPVAQAPAAESKSRGRRIKGKD